WRFSRFARSPAHPDRPRARDAAGAPDRGRDGSRRGRDRIGGRGAAETSGRQRTGHVRPPAPRHLFVAAGECRDEPARDARARAPPPYVSVHRSPTEASAPAALSPISERTRRAYGLFGLFWRKALP